MKCAFTFADDAIYYIALGANIGDSKAYLQQAINALSQYLTLLKASSIYQTKAMYVEDQNDFHNMVLAFENHEQDYRRPHDLLALCKKIEQEIGRVATFRYGPRVIDIDIIAVGDICYHDDDLTIPHERFRERRFVLEPLFEIAPNFIDPVSQKNIAQLSQILD